MWSMTKSRTVAAKSRPEVANRFTRLGTTRGRPPIRTAHDENRLEFSLGLLDDPGMTIILRMRRPGFDEPRVAEGDLVIADRRVKPDDGNLVIAVVGGESVVRRFSTSEEVELLSAPDGSCERTGAAEILATVVSVIPVTPE